MPLERIVLRQGRVGPDHAIEATLRSMPMWSAPRAGFVVMGPAAADYARQLTALAAQCGVCDRFAILPPVGYDDVPAFTADADVGHALYDPVNVNHREMGTASNKLLEYMAAGLACIVPDTPSFAALLARAAFAVPCDPASPEAIAAAVDALLAAPGMAREMGAAGERLFREELAWDRTFPALLARLEALAADCERAARSL
jgi:glycosyltransferase involved in cell wall biosynthesis